MVGLKKESTTLDCVEDFPEENCHVSDFTSDSGFNKKNSRKNYAWQIGSYATFSMFGGINCQLSTVDIK